MLPDWLTLGRKYLESPHQKVNPLNFSYELLVLTSAKSDVNGKLSHW